MYARPSSPDGDEPLSFGVSGRLWRASLVMFDRQTRTLWSQVLGEAVHGRLKGHALEHVPSVRTTWAEWVAAHPETLALVKPADVDGSRYQGYFDSPKPPRFAGDVRDRRLPPKAAVLGLSHGSGDDVSALAVVLTDGVRDVVRTRLAKRRISVVRDGKRAAAWDADGRKLRWARKRAEAVLTERGGNGRWDPWTGASLVSGVPDLTPVDAMKTYWYTWVSFHPRSRLSGLPPGSAQSRPSAQTRPRY